MEQQSRFTQWQEAESARSHCSTPLKVLLSVLVKGVLLMGRDSEEAKWYLFRGIRRGKRGILEWLMGWLRVLFQLISHGLTQQRFRQK